MNSKIYGYDRYMKLIRDDSIISFIHDGKKKIGHIWYYDDPVYKKDHSWIISFNHVYSENSMNLNREKVSNIKVIGFGDFDEYFMKDYYE
jgi:hypothetical protein